MFSKILPGLCVLLIAGCFTEVFAGEPINIRTSNFSELGEMGVCEETLKYVVEAADIDSLSIEIRDTRYNASNSKSAATLAFSIVNNLGDVERHDFTCSFDYGQLEKALLGDMEVEVWP